MSLPQTGGPGLFYFGAGVVLVFKWVFRKIWRALRNYFYLIIFLVVLLLPRPAEAVSMSGSHWNSASNEDGLVFRGATEQRFSLFGVRKPDLLIFFKENHVFGLSGKNWNRKIEGSAGPVVAYRFWKDNRGGVIHFGVEASYGFRPDNASFNLTPFFDFWFGWPHGSSWGTLKRESFGEGLVGRFFIEQGIELIKFRMISLNANAILQGVYGTKSYPWNRKFELMAGPEIKIGKGKLGGYYGVYGVRIKAFYWVDW